MYIIDQANKCAHFIHDICSISTKLVISKADAARNVDVRFIMVQDVKLQQRKGT